MIFIYTLNITFNFDRAVHRVLSLFTQTSVFNEKLSLSLLVLKIIFFFKYTHIYMYKYIHIKFDCNNKIFSLSEDQFV